MSDVWTVHTLNTQTHTERGNSILIIGKLRQSITMLQEQSHMKRNLYYQNKVIILQLYSCNTMTSFSYYYNYLFIVYNFIY